MSLQRTLKSNFFIKPAKEKLFHQGFFTAIAIGMLLGSIALLNVNGAFGYYSVKALQLILFFAVGNLYISSRQDFLKLHPAEKPGNDILLITFSLCVLLSALYIFLRKDVWLMAFSSSAAFMLPFFLKLCWRLFTSIPGKEFNAWFPHERVASGRASVSLDSLLVRLKTTQHVSDVHEKIYTVFVPHYIKLGDFFSYFLTEHNAHAASLIEDKDEKGNKYAWEFFTTGFFGLQSKKLDPDLTMIENKIKNDALVYIKRLIQPDKLLSHNKNLLK